MCGSKKLREFPEHWSDRLELLAQIIDRERHGVRDVAAHAQPELVEVHCLGEVREVPSHVERTVRGEVLLKVADRRFELWRAIGKQIEGIFVRKTYHAPPHFGFRKFLILARAAREHGAHRAERSQRRPAANDAFLREWP